MICKQCGTYYVRDPCPTCNSDNSKDSKTDESTKSPKKEAVRPSQIRERENMRETESGNQVLLQKEEDTLVRPSERLKKERENDEDLPSFQRFRTQEKEQDQLIKPSQRIKEQKREEDQLVKPSERIKQQKTDKKEDQLVKPSERIKQQDDTDEEEHLVKPSERFKKDPEEVPSFKRFDREAVEVGKSRKETEIEKEEEIPSFKRFEQISDEEDMDIETISNRLSKPDQQEKLRNDKEYRNKVKETLEEVMGLLEKLIDED